MSAFPDSGLLHPPLDAPLARLLVSVRDPAEAEAARLAGADLIDAKDPDRGALGALDAARVREIVARIRAEGGARTSAVADGPRGIAAMAATGVDWVKVGLLPGLWGDAAALARAAAAAPGRLIAVLFAEDEPGPELVGVLAAAGFRGAMIDTAGKAGVRLTDLAEPHRLGTFTAACRAHGLMSGLAGSLRVSDIPALTAHRPDYLGFRGGLCRDLDRRNGIDPLRVAEAARALRPGARDAA
ncbi:(5-formylfuran-3-yl)methyl phosphate synthase [Methylobacterium sp. NEAU 140]|uniref:(5-formylfuran-3-yl)methyl phosphate synthase n=1 Tax=Methylobacterium sp. NEAU 140 TaxID=3064945 RepID=UPI002736C66A|nr:(5-formylfuran-3-yl)methyl phosphate synthase [Methylobacterium sp. NEAU 140]MDP4026200.1 (5-formylfuran-3-yl)methyl phosphate synthase [Methylobacterium sp. NEAU 140]